jgi:hypothetical protein
MTEFSNTENPYLQKLQQIVVENGMDSMNSMAFANHMDAQDELKDFRHEFLYPKAPEGKRPIYLCGNSLGLQPKRLRGEVLKSLDKWESQAVEGHFTGWCRIVVLFCFVLLLLFTKECLLFEIFVLVAVLQQHRINGSKWRRR